MGHAEYIYKAGAWGVNLFLILSGYGIFKSYEKNNNIHFFEKRLFKIYIPYLTVTVFVLLYNYIKHCIGIKTIFFSIIGIDFGYICDKTMWYISFIFYHYLFFYFSCLIFGKIKRVNLKHYVIIFSCFIGGFLIYKINIKYMLWNMGSCIYLYFFSFSLGLLISKINIKNNVLYRMVLSVIAFICLLFTLLLYNNVSSCLTYTIYANSLPLLLIALYFLNVLKSFKIINYIGKMSFDIYLWEGFFFSIAKDLFEITYNKYVINFVVIILSIFVSQMYKRVFVDAIMNFLSKKILKESS